MVTAIKLKKGHSCSVDRSVVVKPELSWTEWILIGTLLQLVEDGMEPRLRKQGITEAGIKKYKKIKTKIGIQTFPKVFGIISQSGTKITEQA